MKTQEEIKKFNSVNEHLWNAIHELSKAQKEYALNEGYKDEDLHNLIMITYEISNQLLDIENKYFNLFILNK